jgi:antitoxin component YwqK of YwqJK toxin-antitoxin module
MKRIDVYADNLDRDDTLGLVHEGAPFTGELVDAWGDTLLSLVTYHNGWRHGPAKEWYEDGTLKSEGTNKHGIAVGAVREWHNNGALAVEKLFNDRGELVSEKHWDEYGKPEAFRPTGMPE